MHQIRLAAAIWLLTVSASLAIQIDRKILLGDPATSGGYFGHSVAVQGGLSVVGSVLDFEAGTQAGAAYAFDAAGSPITKLIGNDTAFGDQLGSAVALDNGVALVGAQYAGPGISSGAAYLFNAATGVQLHKLSPSDGGDADDEFFGSAVALRDGFALIGAHQDWLNAGVSDAGSAYLYNASTGAELRKFRAPDASGGDFFGFSVAIGDGLAVIGAPFDDDRGNMSGSAYVFDLSTGAMLRKIVPADGKAGDHFGYSVGTDNGLAVIGAGGTGVISNPGAAYLFDVTDGDQLAKWSSGVANQQDQFGESVAISGSLAIVGAPGLNSGNGGAFLYDTTTKQLLTTLATSSRIGGGEFGLSVALDGPWAMVGEPRAQTAGGLTGAAYRFHIVPEPAAWMLAAFAGFHSLTRQRSC